MVKGAYECLFVVANNAGDQRLWYIPRDGKCEELTQDYVAFVPIGYAKANTTQPLFFARKAGQSAYEPVGNTLERQRFPSFESETPEYFHANNHMLITRSYAMRTLWNTETGQRITKVLGNLDVDTIGQFRGSPAILSVARPDSPRVSLDDWLQKKKDFCPFANSHYAFAKSKDGTAVPFVVLTQCKPKALLCIVYGAYGLPTRLGTERWKPLLKRGWGLCYTFVRGSGDHTDAWAESARRDQKYKSIEDFEACVKAAQTYLGVPAKHTALYGRSAGGYTVGATLARHSQGDLFGAVYAEVPYLDVLNTTANTTLPLTQLEYNEFGNPSRLQDAQTLLNLSPIDSIPDGGAPRIFVLCRTALEDKEVFPYESVKWITRLRSLEKGATQQPKLLAITAGSGHFAQGKTAQKQRAEDLALLLSWQRS